MNGIEGTAIGDLLLVRCRKDPALTRKHLVLWNEELRKHRHNDECGGCAELQRVISELEKLAAAQLDTRERYP